VTYCRDISWDGGLQHVVLFFRRRLWPNMFWTTPSDVPREIVLECGCAVSLRQGRVVGSGVSFRQRCVTSFVSGLLGENAAYGRAPDLQSAGDLSLAHARAEQFPHMTGVDCCCNWPPQSLAA